MRKGSLLVLAVFVALGLSACGSTGANTANSAPASSSPPAVSSPDASSASVTITIMNFGYQVSASAAPGETVNVTNHDSVAHTVTADSGNLFNANVSGGGTGSFVAPTKPGTYQFHCIYHGNMHGTLVVK